MNQRQRKQVRAKRVALAQRALDAKMYAPSPLSHGAPIQKNGLSSPDTLMLLTHKGFRDHRPLKANGPEPERFGRFDYNLKRSYGEYATLGGADAEPKSGMLVVKQASGENKGSVIYSRALTLRKA